MSSYQYPRRFKVRLPVLTITIGTLTTLFAGVAIFFYITKKECRENLVFGVAVLSAAAGITPELLERRA